MRKYGNYLLINNSNRVLLDHKKQPLFAFEFEDRETAETVVNTINNLYGSDLGYLGYVDWLSGLQQIHQTDRNRYMFGDLVDALTSLNCTISKEHLAQCSELVARKFSMKSRKG